MTKEKVKEYVKTVPFDEDFETMLNCAVRYACGRKTYIVSLVCDYIKPLIPSISDKWLHNISESIKSQQENAFVKEPLGDPCDTKDWLELKRLVDTELQSRKGM